MDSDHHLVKATIRAQISNMRTIQQKKRKKINTEALKDEITARNFSNQVEQLLEGSEQQQSEELNVEQKWEICIKTLTKTAERC